MGRFAIIFLPLFVVIALMLFRRMFSAQRRAGYATSGGRWLSALASWLLTALAWSFIIYLVFLTVLFFVFQVDFGAFWSSPEAPDAP
jgi:ABC-type Fe3+ transport system permease subunit